MKNIDFLPEIYRERIVLRKDRVWWGIVVVIFSTAIGSTAGAQYLLKRSVQRQFDELGPQYVAAQQQVQRLTELQSQNRTAGQWASLVTYLDQPWPRSQLLAVVVQPLPPSIRLTELLVAEEEFARASAEEAGPRRRGNRQDEQQKTKLAPASADLEHLRRTHDNKRPIVEISGTVQDMAVLHEYVAVLARSPLVALADIKSYELAATNALAKPTNFTVRVVFRASHGQTDGDQGPTAQKTLRVARGGSGS